MKIYYPSVHVLRYGSANAPEGTCVLGTGLGWGSPCRVDFVGGPRLPDVVDVGVSVVVPTYREVLNLPLLLPRLAEVRKTSQLDLEVLIMDDSSRDGSAEAVAELGLPWVRFVERTSNRGLSPAVVDGLRLSSKEYVVVMDADLSHPAEKIPELLALLQRGRDFAIGSRYVAGGTTDDDWGLFRWLNSRIATLLCRPLTSALDPMAGFFAMRRDDIHFELLNPIGYKIGLELIVKCGLRVVGEVPIHFTDRTLGESKLSLREQLKYLQHLRRLYIFRFGTWSEFVQFAMVGTSGVVVNLVVLSLLLWAGLERDVAIALAIAVSMVTNFGLNRRFTFSYARSDSIIKQFFGFVSASAVGAAINYLSTLGILSLWPTLWVQLAALGGVLMGLGFNFVANRFLVFRKRHIRPRD